MISVGCLRTDTRCFINSTNKNFIMAISKGSSNSSRMTLTKRPVCSWQRGYFEKLLIEREIQYCLRASSVPISRALLISWIWLKLDILFWARAKMYTIDIPMTKAMKSRIIWRDIRRQLCRAERDIFSQLIALGSTSQALNDNACLLYNGSPEIYWFLQQAAYFWFWIYRRAYRSATFWKVMKASTGWYLFFFQFITFK